MEVGTATVSVSVKMLRTCSVLSGSLKEVKGAELTPLDVPTPFSRARVQLVCLGDGLVLTWDG